MFLNRAELRIIQADFEGMLQAEDATEVIAYFQTPYFPEETIVPDPVFGTIEQGLEHTPESIPLRCIIQLITGFHIRQLATGLVEQGDAILYFSNSINFELLKPGKPTFAGSLYFKDSTNSLWYPKATPKNERLRMVSMFYGANICQAIPCATRRA